MCPHRSGVRDPPPSPEPGHLAYIYIDARCGCLLHKASIIGMTNIMLWMDVARSTVASDIGPREAAGTSG